jgi:hypothetical protein
VNACTSLKSADLASVVAHEMASTGVMVFEDVDFSYLGVYGLWNFDIGKFGHNGMI